MYDKKLSEIFHQRNSNGQLQDADGYPWVFRIKNRHAKKTKIFYAIGDSWIDSLYFNRVFHNQYPEYFLINRAIGGNSNSSIINMLEQDMSFLRNLDVEVYILVAFSEVGRSLQDFRQEHSKSFSSTHDYFGEILRKQYYSVKKILTGHKAYITTAFITNNFNSNVSIVDCCDQLKENKPKNVFTVTSNGIFEFMKKRKKIFPFDLANDVDKSLQLKKFLESHDSIDDTLHIDCYKPYEDFLKKVFSDLQKI